MNKKILLIAIVFFVIGLIVYFPGIQAPRYGDDFNIVPEGNLKEDLYKIWTTPYQREMFYRPLEDTITILIIHFFGWDTTPVHILILLFHAAFVSFAYYAMVKLKFSHNAALFGSLYILIAQVNVFTAGSNDTLGTMLSSFFCLTALWFFYEAISDENGKVNSKPYIISMVLFIISLLSKEASVTFFPFLLVLILYKNSFFNPVSFAKIKKSIIVSLPFVIIFIIYYIIHSAIVIIQPAMDSSNYGFRFGFNVPKNIGMMLFSIFLPVSSVRTFEAVQLKDYKFLLAALFLTLIFSGIIFYGIWKSKRVKEALLWFCFLIAGFFPMVLMNHVNEQYTYFSMPFAAILIAIGTGCFLDKTKGKSRTIFTAVFILFLLLNTFFVMEKSRQMQETGEKADMLFEQIGHYLPQIEPNGTLVLVNPPDKQIRYSVFRLPGFETMRYAQFYIYKLAGRQDFKIEIIDWDDIEKWKKPHTLILKLEGNKVLRME